MLKTAINLVEDLSSPPPPPHSLSLSLSLSLSVSHTLAVCLSVYPSLSVSVSHALSVYLSACLSVFLSQSVSVCLSLSLVSPSHFLQMLCIYPYTSALCFRVVSIYAISSASQTYQSPVRDAYYSSTLQYLKYSHVFIIFKPQLFLNKRNNI